MILSGRKRSATSRAKRRINRIGMSVPRYQRGDTVFDGAGCFFAMHRLYQTRAGAELQCLFRRPRRRVFAQGGIDMKRLLLTAAAAVLFCAAASADNWPMWRGANGDGVTKETDLPLKWSATENVRWKVQLPERGNSTPIVWGDRIFLTAAIEKKNLRTLMCFDRKDGKPLWQREVEYTEKETTHGTNPYCSAS